VERDQCRRLVESGDQAHSLAGGVRPKRGGPKVTRGEVAIRESVAASIGILSTVGIGTVNGSSAAWRLLAMKTGSPRADRAADKPSVDRRLLQDERTRTVGAGGAIGRGQQARLAMTINCPRSLRAAPCRRQDGRTVIWLGTSHRVFTRAQAQKVFVIRFWAHCSARADPEAVRMGKFATEKAQFTT
jgi:hypothetical protein